MNLTMWSWSLCSIQYDSVAPAIRYGGALLLLGIFVWSIGLLDKKQMRSGVVIMAAFSNIGLAVAYRCTSEEALVLRISDLKDTYAGQTVFIVGGFILVYCVVRFTRIYKTTLWNVAAGVSVLVVAFGARLTGTKTGGSYLYFGNIMVFSWVLLCFPFIASFLLSRKEDAYVHYSLNDIERYMKLVYLAFKKVDQPAGVQGSELEAAGPYDYTQMINFLREVSGRKDKEFRKLLTAMLQTQM